MTETQTFRIDRLGHRGDGIARDDGGREIFISFALPGETVAGTPEDGRIAAPAILTPAPERAAPPCPAFGACGGCALQHASEDYVADWKRDLVAAALAARGLGDTPVEPTATSPARSRRRATLSGRRTKKTAFIGFHGARSAIIEPLDPGCALLRPEIMAAREDLGELVRVIASRKGELKIAVAVSDEGLDVSAEGARTPEGSDRAALAALADKADWARLTVNDEAIVTRRPPVRAFGRARVAPPPGGFQQATAEGEAALLAELRATVGKAGRIADLFCGAGAFALPLAENAEVLAVESEPAALAALETGWRATGGALRRVIPLQRDLFRRPLLAAELKPFEAVVIDPPRAGAEAQSQALAELAAAALPGPTRIGFVSCNPASFARDARILVDAGWRLTRAVPVDQFRWSPHVELVARFERG